MLKHSHLPLRPSLTLLSAVIALALANGAQAGDATMDAWRDYARASLTPDFDWVEQAPVAAPSMMGRALMSHSALFASAWDDSGRTPIQVNVSTTISGDSPQRNSSFGALRDIDLPQAGLVRKVVSAGIQHSLSDQSRFTAGIVLATQQFASFGLGTEVVDTYGAGYQDLSESRSGSGVRVGYERDLNDQLSIGTQVQSKVNMEAFQSYRGFFADPGDFDLPARASLTARWQPLPYADFSVSAQRIFYSDLIAFSSRSLPTSILSLLNDGSQPQLTWRDLDVLSLDVGFDLSAADRVTVTYSTQQQPEPSSRVLLQAFSELLTDNNYALGYEHQFARAGKLRFAASYAPTEYYLGNVSALQTNIVGSQVEAEAVWRFDF